MSLPNPVLGFSGTRAVAYRLSPSAEGDRPDHRSGARPGGTELPRRSVEEAVRPTRSALRAFAPLLLLVLLALAAPPADAQRRASVLDDPAFQADARQGLDALYSLRFDEAERQFDQIATRYPKHPVGPFLQALVPWWQILLDLSDTRRDDQFLGAMQDVADRADEILKKDDRDPDGLFFKAAAHGFRARHFGNRRAYFAAARDGLRALDAVLALQRQDPQNPDYRFGTGLYNYYRVVVPREHKVARPFAGAFPPGDRSGGLGDLHVAFRQGRFVQAEAAYFLLQIYYRYERDYAKTMQFARYLREQYPENAFFHALEGRVHARFGRWDRSEAAFRGVMRGYIDKKTGYNDAAAEQALYYLARARMNEGEHAAALDLLARLEALGGATQRETAFEVLGRLRQGMALDLLGRRDEARRRYREVVAMREVGSSRADAQRYLDTPYR